MMSFARSFAACALLLFSTASRSALACARMPSTSALFSLDALA